MKAVQKKAKFIFCSSSVYATTFEPSSERQIESKIFIDYMDFAEFKSYVQEWAKNKEGLEAFQDLGGESGTQKVDDLRAIHTNLTQLQWN